MTDTAIQDKLTEFYTAFNAKTWDALAACLLNDFSYVTDNSRVLDKAVFVTFRNPTVQLGSALVRPELE